MSGLLGGWARGVFRLLLFALVAGTVPADGEMGESARTPIQGSGKPGTGGSPTDTLGLDQGYLEFKTPDFDLRLLKASQTVAALKPTGVLDFDFAPGDRLFARSSDGFYHLGDLTLRVRPGESGPWRELSTADNRKPVRALPVAGQILAAADLAPTLGQDFPLHVVRSWELVGQRLVLRFSILNRAATSIQIGALGIPLVFNNILTGRSLEEAHRTCSFADPYIGQDAGYLQVTRLSGLGPAMLVVPEGMTPFEAYRPLAEPTPSSQTFEGSFEWMAHSQAYAEGEWTGAEPWNRPTMTTLAPGEERSFGVRFLLSDEIRNLETTLRENGRPVAVGIPGYILPMDLEGLLFLSYSSPVAGIGVEPEGALSVTRIGPSRSGWAAYSLRGRKWGRVRMSVVYSDGLRQVVSCYVIRPAAEAVDALGNFLMTKQWFAASGDPFFRSPSVMGYDKEAAAIITQDPRVWIAGLSDEGGSGSWLAAVLKQYGRPSEEEIAKLEQFINNVLWGRIQYSDGDRKFGVRKSLFFYAPKIVPADYYNSNLDWGTWSSWGQEEAEAVDRSFNYPHVAAAYWVFYCLARDYRGLVSSNSWDWYLEHAYRTSLAMVQFAPGYARHGQMEGDVFLEILRSLKREGWNEKASELEERMRARAGKWKEQSFPFGSEMAWDSTGQEEVYAWCKHFGYESTARTSLNSILGYMPTVPHWGYSGCARRYWDFLYAGKLRRIERQLHHYGSGINAIPLLTEYREEPDDFYLLRVGYAGMMGALTNIDSEGFASAAFHSFPETLRWDAYSGDYGPNFFGHAFATATYVVKHPSFGWCSFGGNLTVEGDRVRVKPLDSFRKRVYVAPVGLWLTLDAGTFESVELNLASGAIRVWLSPVTRHLKHGRLRVEQPAQLAGIGAYRPTESFAVERGAFAIPLESGKRLVELTRGD